MNSLIALSYTSFISLWGFLCLIAMNSIHTPREQLFIFICNVYWLTEAVSSYLLFKYHEPVNMINYKRDLFRLRLCYFLFLYFYTLYEPMKIYYYYPGTVTNYYEFNQFTYKVACAFYIIYEFCVYFGSR